MASETAETEETLTCLLMTLYHPNQEVFSDLSFSERQQVKADDVVKFGRDSSACHFNLQDRRVSRVQFALQFFKPFNSREFSFEIKNLSKNVNLTVNGVELSYLNKVDLPDNCILCFGEYEILLEKQGGKSNNYFDICFELSYVPLLLDRDISFHQPVPERGISHTETPVEIDENEWEKSHKGREG